MFHFFLLFSWFRWRGLLAGGLLLAGLAAQAQAPPAWRTAILSTPDRGNQSGIDAATTDANGNVYVVGSFLGTIQIGNTTLTSAGDVDVFVAKWSNSTNSYVWAQRAGGLKTDYVEAVSVSGTSVYITGVFYGPTATFGSTTLTNADAGANSCDIFVAKLTDAGTSSSFTWVQRAGGTNSDAVTGIAADGTNLYVVGTFASAAASFGTTTLTNASNSTDIFVAKLTDAGSTGRFSWAQRAGGESQEEATSVAVQGQNVYVAGFFRSRTATFGSFTLPNLSTGSFAADAFLVKLVDAGATASFAWARQAGGDEDDKASGVAVSGNNVYVTGWFNSPTVRFGATTLATPRYYSAAFVAKLTDTGATSAFQWAQQSQSQTSGYTLANSLAVVGTSVYVAGEFYNAPTRFGATTLPGAGSMDVFVTKLTDAGPTGSFAWAQQAGGPGFDRPTAVAVAGGQVCVAGLLTGTGSFGALSLAAEGGHGFLATLADGAVPVVPVVRINRPALPALSCARDTTITLSANVPDGTWAGRGITDAQRGTFRSSVAGPGRHVLTYSVAGVGQDTCSLVVRPVLARILTPPPTLCRLDTIVRLAATPAGGTWRGPGISDPRTGLFDGAAAGPGRHILRYVVGSGACQSADSVAVLLRPVAAPVLSPAGPLILRCAQQGELLSIANTGAGPTTYEWQYAALASTSWQGLASAGGLPTYRASLPGRYRVRATQGSCAAFSAPVEVRVEPVQALVVPTIFTPNHDGVNDLFELRLQYPRTSHLQVFNRWGRLVFSTDTYGDFWKGTDASEGVYYYLWRYSTDCEPTEQLLKGFITVVR